MPKRDRSKQWQPKPRNYERYDFGDGYYFSYRQKANGVGGYKSVEITLNNDELNLHREINDEHGAFIDYPGDGGEGFDPVVEFAFHVEWEPDGMFRFGWLVQPDGRYYADEDGFGMEDDEEIYVVARMDRQGNFLEEFHRDE